MSAFNLGCIKSAACGNLFEQAIALAICGAYFCMGKALTNVVRNTVAFISAEYGLTPQDTSSLCSTDIDFGLAEAADLNLVMYGKVPKSYFAKKTAYWK